MNRYSPLISAMIQDDKGEYVLLEEVLEIINNWFDGRGNMEKWEWTNLKNQLNSPNKSGGTCTADNGRIVQTSSDTILLEKLANLEHQQWAELMSYLLKYSYLRADKFKKTDWEDLMKTPYKDLTEIDKEKDRKFARKVLEVINSHMTSRGTSKEADILPFKATLVNSGSDDQKADLSLREPAEVLTACGVMVAQKPHELQVSKFESSHADLLCKGCNKLMTHPNGMIKPYCEYCGRIVR